MKMYDMAYKMEGQEDKNKMYYPTLYISKKIPDDLKKKDVGDTCRLEVVGKITSKSESDRGESLEIEVHKMGYIGKGGKKTREEYLKMNDEEREEYDKKDTGVDNEKEDNPGNHNSDDKKEDY